MIFAYLRGERSKLSLVGNRQRVNITTQERSEIVVLFRVDPRVVEQIFGRAAEPVGLFGEGHVRANSPPFSSADVQILSVGRNGEGRRIPRRRNKPQHDGSGA